MKNIKQLLIIFSLSTIYMAYSTAPVIMPKPEEMSNYDEATFQKLMKEWNKKIKDLEAGKAPTGLFEVAEKIIKMNDDQFANLAEDLSKLLKNNEKRTVLRKAWLPHQNNPAFINSEAESLFEMAIRLADVGNG